MKKSINIGLILLLLFQACSTEENSSDNINIESSTEDTIINDSSSIDKVSTENIVEELLAEFPQSIFYYLLKSEQVCLVEIEGSGLGLKFNSITVVPFGCSTTGTTF